MPARDVGALVAIATVVRVNLEAHGEIPDGLFDRCQPTESEALGRYQLGINKLAAAFARRRQPHDSAAAMIWSYSLRCLNVPEFRPLGRRLWDELRRGFPYVEEALEDGQDRREEPLPRQVWTEWRRIPAGLEGE